MNTWSEWAVVVVAPVTHTGTELSLKLVRSLSGQDGRRARHVPWLKCLMALGKGGQMHTVWAVDLQHWRLVGTFPAYPSTLTLPVWSLGQCFFGLLNLWFCSFCLSISKANQPYIYFLLLNCFYTEITFTFTIKSSFYIIQYINFRS